MTERTRGPVSMHFSDGETIDTFQAVSLHESYTDPLSELTFETRPPAKWVQDYRKRLAKGELVTIFVAGVNQGGFLIVDSDRTHDEQGTTFHITCKTPLCTIFEADVEAEKATKQQTDVPVEQVILDVLSQYGFTSIVADSKAHVDAITGRPIGGHAPPPNLTELTIKEASAHPGETVYQYLARIMTVRGVCLRMAADGTLLVGAPDYEQDPAYTLCRVIDPRNGVRGADWFIGAVEVKDTNEGQFSEYRVLGQRDSGLAQVGNPATARPDSGKLIESELHPDRPGYRSPVAAPYKPKIIKHKSARDKKHARNACALEAGLRAAKAFHIKGMVDGFVSMTGRIWSVDTMARIVIEQEEMDESMWLLERTLHVDPQGGQRTTLKFLPKGTLTIGDPSAE